MIVSLKKRVCLGAFSTGFFTSLRWRHGLNKRGAGDEREARVGMMGTSAEGTAGDCLIVIFHLVVRKRMSGYDV